VIAVQAAGAITPVGFGLADTMAAIYTRVQLFEDLGVLDTDGEPLSGMKIPFEDDLAGPERIAAMAHDVVDECTAGVEADGARIPLFLCCPETTAFGQDATDFPARLLAEVIAKAPIPLDAGRSRIVARGRAGSLEALGAALALLKEPSVPYCLVGGVDSLVEDGRVQVLADGERLLTQTNKDGFIAGEAGAMLLLSSRPAPGALASWLAAAAGNEEAARGSDQPITGAGMQEAVTKALALAKTPFESLGCLAHDFSGEARYFEELLLAGSRLAKTSANHVTEVPALSVGETGAAAPFLTIAMLAFLHGKGVHTGPSLAVLSCDGPERGAVVLGPAPAGRR
jgi:3-oxoacyl-[acyl-carrier-protein] synthase-1